MGRYLIFCLLAAGVGFGCKKGPAGAGGSSGPPSDTGSSTPAPPAFDINSIEDTYADVAPLADDAGVVGAGVLAMQESLSRAGSVAGAGVGAVVGTGAAR